MPCQIQVTGTRTCVMLLKRLRPRMQLSDAPFYGVMVVDFEDAMAERCHGIAEGGTTTTTTDVLWLASELRMEMRSATTGIYWKCDRDTPVKRDELSFDSEEGAAKEQMARKDTTGAGGHCWDGAAGRQRQWEEGRRRHDWAAGSSRDGGERVVARDGAGCGVGSDPFTATHAVAELTMGAAGD
ncbi:hypothetical protein GW17_00035680 [Ensete ventricosum]|nr:hypothetical protein GW17_00035680 [Ensete ventricosum]